MVENKEGKDGEEGKESKESEDEPVCELRAIYQKGIELALCNFEGNDNELIW